jgi:hypothetical protein
VQYGGPHIWCNSVHFIKKYTCIVLFHLDLFNNKNNNTVCCHKTLVNKLAGHPCVCVLLYYATKKSYLRIVIHK